MTTYQIVLYIHLLALLLATGAAAVTHIAFEGMRRAGSLSEAGRWGLLAKSTARAFPVAVIGLFGSGAYLVSDAWTWDTPWVLAAICGLVAIVVVGDLVNGRNGMALGKAIGGAIASGGDGPLTGEVVRRLESPLTIAAIFAPTVLMLGIVFVMTAKPGAGGSAATLLVSLAVSAALGLLLARRPAVAPAPATEA